jgi:hypothetical protein
MVVDLKTQNSCYAGFLGARTSSRPDFSSAKQEPFFDKATRKALRSFLRLKPLPAGCYSFCRRLPYGVSSHKMNQLLVKIHSDQVADPVCEAWHFIRGNGLRQGYQVDVIEQQVAASTKTHVPPRRLLPPNQKSIAARSLFYWWNSRCSSPCGKTKARTGRSRSFIA